MPTSSRETATIDVPRAYDELIHQSKEQALLGSCSALLSWDEQTYLPQDGAGHRSGQMALLAGLHHERATDPKIGELLEMLEGSDWPVQVDSVPAINIRELRRTYDRRVRLPRTLVEELARITSLAQAEWVAARSASDFGRFRPWLERIIQLKREEAACLARVAPATTTQVPGTPAPAGAAEGSRSSLESAYDPLLDEYEPGANSADLAVLFRALERELLPLVALITEAARRKAADMSGRGLRPISVATLC